MIDLGHKMGVSNKFCSVSVLPYARSSVTHLYRALFLGRRSPIFFIFIHYHSWSSRRRYQQTDGRAHDHSFLHCTVVLRKASIFLAACKCASFFLFGWSHTYGAKTPLSHTKFGVFRINVRSFTPFEVDKSLTVTCALNALLVLLFFFVFKCFSFLLWIAEKWPPCSGRLAAWMSFSSS